MPIILFIMSLIPVFLILYLIYSIDTIEKESLKILIPLFIGGCLSLALIKFLAGIFYDIDPEILYGDFSFVQQFFEKFSLVGVVEELSKWIILNIIVFRNKEFNYVFDGIVYAVFVSMGFAVVENFNYLRESADIMTLISRSLITVPAHACFGIIMGAYIGDAKYYKIKGFLTYKAFFIPMILHGIYDFLLSFDTKFIYIFLVYFVFLLFISIRKVVKYQNKSNAEINNYNINYGK